MIDAVLECMDHSFLLAIKLLVNVLRESLCDFPDPAPLDAPDHRQSGL